ncbi:16712_t:CDS:2, partial [Dentiscutata heterogama]
PKRKRLDIKRTGLTTFVLMSVHQAQTMTDNDRSRQQLQTATYLYDTQLKVNPGLFFAKLEKNYLFQEIHIIHAGFHIGIILQRESIFNVSDLTVNEKTCRIMEFLLKFFK